MSVAVVSIHDVAPATLHQSRVLLDLVEQIRARASLLVVPGPWRSPATDDDPCFGEWLRAAIARGHEVVVHGWEHQAIDDPNSDSGVVRRASARLLARGCAEFATLGRDEAHRRSAAGLKVLRRLGADPVGFTPPGWLASPAALDGLRDTGFAYTTSRTAVLDLHGGRRLRIPAYCQRPASPISRPAARAVDTIVTWRAAVGRPVRVALHPADADDPALLTSAQRMMTALAVSELSVTTYGALVGIRRPVRGPVG